MKIVLVGGGKVGTALARQLSEEGHNVTVVDTNKARVEHIGESYDVMSILGNGSSITTLSEAGVEEADVFIAVTGSDELNLLCCLIAKKAGNGGTAAVKRKKKRDTFYDEVELALAGVLARRVKVYNGKGSGGSIEIEFFGKDDLKKLAEQLEALE